MLENVLVFLMVLAAVTYLIWRIFFRKKTCDSCGMVPSKK